MAAAVFESEIPVFCFDIGGTFIKFGLSKAPGDLVQLDKIPTPKASWSDIVAAVGGLIDRYGHLGDPSSPAALSLAAAIDSSGVATAANIPCLSGIDPAAKFTADLGRRVVVANDADCLTLAEANEGAGRGHEVVFCAILGTGVGGGLAVGGRLVRGSGEWGHGPVIAGVVDCGDGPVTIPVLPCACGQSGCVDTIGGARGIERLHGLLHGSTATSLDIVNGWQAGDPAASRTVTGYLNLISGPLALVVNVTGATAVPVGGGLASATPLIAAIDRAVRQRVLQHSDSPLVVPAHRREDGGMAGAAIVGRRAMANAAVN